jgi:hypothetical protein
MIFFGKPVPTPHQVRGKLFPDHALDTIKSKTCVAADLGGNDEYLSATKWGIWGCNEQ